MIQEYTIPLGISLNKISLDVKAYPISLGVNIREAYIPIVSGLPFYWQWDVDSRVLWGDNTPIRIN